MTYEARTNGTRALRCDTPGCTGELIAPDDQDLAQDANWAGWSGAVQAAKHICGNCMRGVHTGATLVKQALGGKDVVQVRAPSMVCKGGPFRDPATGEEVGTYLADARQGEPVDVRLTLPSVAAQVQVSPQYAAILGASRASSVPESESEEEDLFSSFEVPPGTESAPDQVSSFPDDLDQVGEPDPVEAAVMELELTESEAAQFRQEVRDGKDLGRVTHRHRMESLFKPSRRTPEQQELDKRAELNARAKAAGKPTMAMTAPPGTAGGSGLVKEPQRPTPEQVERAAIMAKRKKPEGPPIDLQKLLETSNLFGALSRSGGSFSDDNK